MPIAACMNETISYSDDEAGRTSAESQRDSICEVCDADFKDGFQEHENWPVGVFKLV